MCGGYHRGSNRDSKDNKDNDTALDDLVTGVEVDHQAEEQGTRKANEAVMTLEEMLGCSTTLS